MESRECTMELAQFYRAVAAWPQTDTELSAVAARIARLCHVPFAAVCSATMGVPTEPGAGERVGVHFGNPQDAGRVSEVAVKEFLKSHVKKVGTQWNGELQQITITREQLPLFNIPSLKIITLSGVVGDVWIGPSVRDGRARRDFGWIIVASGADLDAQQELLLLSASHRLSELAELAQLESMISLRSQFLSIASHELKTPLTSIYGVLQLQERMLRLKADDPPQTQLERQHSFLKMVIRQVERLNELIDGLLDVSRIQNGRFMVEPTETDVAVVLNETLTARLNVIAEEAGVKLEVDAPANLMAWVDPVRFEEVVTNLIMNAIRFSPEGGAVWIRLKDDAGAFRFLVRDQGPSVPLEDRERIFQPFERAQRTSRLGGLGLGLFISRQIAQLHGGNVSLVESIPGKGNVFEANFPMRDVSVISA